MTSPEQAGRAASTASLSVPAFPDQLRLLRAMVRAAADHHGLSMDALADLVIAVDEAATTLVSHARRSSTLVCTFDAVTCPSRLRVILAATTSSPVDASTSSFGWIVLRTLVDDVMFEQTPAAAPTGDRSVTITLEKALPASS
ncbi:MULTISPECIES: ATP-binding protein [Rhodococcus]|uniref:ATP-binding protein n=1 Tax=Rhodococcus qingshengii JCM 15477 TaxID=1303681 RepID=A0AB38RPD5_RHOSG|nr:MULTISPECIES: ATP-binding protein [Rhodococcus]MDA3635328.1 ATP-binding protein [Rhodococcus sp. C-2]UPU46771.1 ATP-binding protein [Rhodococcus qingshengii JCM 15477]